MRRRRIGFYLGIQLDEALLGLVDEVVPAFKPFLKLSLLHFKEGGFLRQFLFQMRKLCLLMKEASVQGGIRDVFTVGLD